MKRFSLKELLEMAGDTFQKLHVEKLYATSDGQFFIDENRAVLHATPNNLSVFQLASEEVEEKEVQPAKVAEPVKPVEPAKPVEPIKPTKSAAPKPAAKKK